MATRTRDYVDRASRYPRYAWEESRDAYYRVPEPVRHPSTGTLAGLAIVGLCVAAGIYYGADLVRYLQMRRM
ncbi:MAG: hypothetical protein KY475_05430 [Planctomycetes bacterium]|nr:hypothetical protein [Planctomycetota bacterium]